MKCLGFRLLAIPAALVVAVAFSGSALASASDVVVDCNDNSTLDRKYSKGELQGALKSLPKDLDQYSDCRYIIQRALLNQISKQRKNTSANPSAAIANATTAAERKKIAKAVDDAVKVPDNGPVTQVDGAPVERGSGKTLASSAGPGVPSGLLVALVGLMLLLGADAAGRRDRLPAIARLLPGKWFGPRS